MSIRSLFEPDTLRRRGPSSALPLCVFYPRLYLNIFRGEPAIAEFDWHFTPNHRSSPVFATTVGSGLHLVLPRLHPAHG